METQPHDVDRDEGSGWEYEYDPKETEAREKRLTDRGPCC